MAKGDAIFISKLDAAKRQLDFAIRMFFRYSDVVVLHTIAAAAHEVLCDIGEKQGKYSIMRDLSIVREDKKEEVRRIMREPQNFFKHADRKGDESKTIEFIPEMTEFIIFDSCRIYRSIVQENPALLFLYETWFYCKRPDILMDDKHLEAIKNLSRNMNYLNRNEFIAILPDLEANLDK